MAGANRLRAVSVVSSGQPLVSAHSHHDIVGRLLKRKAPNPEELDLFLGRWRKWTERYPFYDRV